MQPDGLYCTEEECILRRDAMVVMTFSELSQQLVCCEKCYEGIFKQSDVASKTYEVLSVLWAERYNAGVGKH